MAPTDGIHLTKQIRMGGASPNKYVPIIMVTGHTEKARVEAARDAGVTEFLAKPITVQNLMSRLSEIVERPRPFVKCDTYFGPERRRRKVEGYSGPWRRHEDFKDDLEIR
jgi:DNA-binding response OmpR family regulator